MDLENERRRWIGNPGTCRSRWSRWSRRSRSRRTTRNWCIGSSAVSFASLVCGSMPLSSSGARGSSRRRVCALPEEARVSGDAGMREAIFFRKLGDAFSLAIEICSCFSLVAFCFSFCFSLSLSAFVRRSFWKRSCASSARVRSHSSAVRKTPPTAEQVQMRFDEMDSWGIDGVAMFGSQWLASYADALRAFVAAGSR